MIQVLVVLLGFALAFNPLLFLIKIVIQKKLIYKDTKVEFPKAAHSSAAAVGMLIFHFFSILIAFLMLNDVSALDSFVAPLQSLSGRQISSEMIAPEISKLKSSKFLKFRNTYKLENGKTVSETVVVSNKQKVLERKQKKDLKSSRQMNIYNLRYEYSGDPIALYLRALDSLIRSSNNKIRVGISLILILTNLVMWWLLIFRVKFVEVKDPSK